MKEPIEIKDVTQLLQSITVIRSKYDEINRLTGADYNIFNVLKLQSDEVRLHSRFIGDLLNPKGKHGRGSVFLNLFLEQIDQIINKTNTNRTEEDRRQAVGDLLNVSKAKIIIEQYIGLVKTDEGGRIDLVLADGNKTIVIENKIHAEDQGQQLIRYYNKYPNATMIYLTLNGKEASPISVISKENDDNDKKIMLEADVDYIRMSYEEDIINWLDSSVQCTTNYPFLRESINQYLNIIKQLTGQSMNKKMDDQIKDAIIKSPEAYKSAQLLSKNLNNARSALLGRYRDMLQEELEKWLNLNGIKYHIDLTSKLSSKSKTKIVFDIEGKEQIIFEISRMLLPKSSNSKKYYVNPQLYFGFRYDSDNNDEKKDEIEKLKNKLKSHFESNKWWLAKFISDDNFSNNYILLADDDTMNKRIGEVSKEMEQVLVDFFNMKTV